MPFIEVSNLTKSFRPTLRLRHLLFWPRGQAITALDNVSFSLEAGQVMGLVGANGAGKSTLIKTIATLVLPDKGTITLDGEEGILAHIDIQSPYRVGKYGVDIEKFEQVGVVSLEKAAMESHLVVIDEIGKMELFSPRFKEVVLKIISSGRMILGTVMLAPHPWADSLKEHPQVNLVSITRANHQEVLQDLRVWLGSSR